METLLSSLLTDPVPKLMEAFSRLKLELDWLGGILTTLGELVFTLHRCLSPWFVVKTL